MTWDSHQCQLCLDSVVLLISLLVTLFYLIFMQSSSYCSFQVVSPPCFHYIEQVWHLLQKEWYQPLDWTKMWLSTSKFIFCANEVHILVIWTVSSAIFFPITSCNFNPIKITFTVELDKHSSTTCFTFVQSNSKLFFDWHENWGYTDAWREDWIDGLDACCVDPSYGWFDFNMKMWLSCDLTVVFENFSNKTVTVATDHGPISVNIDGQIFEWFLSLQSGAHMFGFNLAFVDHILW